LILQLQQDLHHLQWFEGKEIRSLLMMGKIAKDDGFSAFCDSNKLLDVGKP
jgi:hypothetical protein